MAWITFAIVSAAISGANAILDSHLLSRRLPGLSAYLLPLGIFHFTVGLIILLVKPFPAGAAPLPVFAAIGTGIIGGVASVITLNVIRQGEVSRIIPVVNTSPLFVALFAVPLLGEMLNIRDWAGIVLTVAGAVLISIQKDGGGGKTQMQKSFLALAFCSLLSAIGTTIMKYALGTLSFWNVYSANSMCLALVFIVFSARPATFKQIGSLPHRNQVLGLTLLNQASVVVAIVLSVVAVQKGPVSLASTVLSSRPAFVFLYALALSRFFPGVINEKLTPGTAVLKFSAIALIIAGIALITL